MRSQREDGFGLIQVMVILGIISLTALTVVQSTQKLTRTAYITKAQIGRDSLTNGLLSILSEEALCTQQLTQPPPGTTISPIHFSTAAAKLAGGCSSSATSCPPYSARQNLRFTLSNNLTSTTPNSIGFTTLSAANPPPYFGQFNAFVGSIYFSQTAAGVPETAAGNPSLVNSTVYRGQLWVNVGMPDGEQLAKSTSKPASLAMADRMITDKLSIWVNNATGNIVGCGILKSPEQVCVDDMGGKWVGGSTPCTFIQSPCDQIGLVGYYFLGLKGGKPDCVPSAAFCPNNNTVVSDGAGGWTCGPMPL